jgi:hypothetical protein
MEAWVANPFSPKAKKFMDSLEIDDAFVLPEDPATRALATRKDAESSSSGTITDRSAIISSPFNSFTPEILHEILLCLPYTDLQKFTLSGISSSPLTTVQGFWKRKLFIDMPWLWDFSYLEREQNWFSIYHELRRQCYATSAPSANDANSNSTNVVGNRDPTLVLSLANRRRIWEACIPLVTLYLQELERRGDKEEGEIEKESISLPTTLVAYPEEKSGVSLRTCFLAGWGEIKKKNEFTFYFEEDGRLIGIEMDVEGNTDRRIFGNKTDKQELVIVPKDTWISDFEIVLSGAESMAAKAKVGICGVIVSCSVLIPCCK